ncbi:MAG: hypothetical protein CM15mP36_12410 [Flavobacteriales bacterium]|nr:MAG: hypothetical protein CM15mP36_12410 [Flavobacteriales bacterium]
MSITKKTLDPIQLAQDLLNLKMGRKHQASFEKNNDYFQKDVDGSQLPYLEAVSVTFLPEKQSEFYSW